MKLIYQRFRLILSKSTKIFESLLPLLKKTAEVIASNQIMKPRIRDTHIKLNFVKECIVMEVEKFSNMNRRKKGELLLFIISIIIIFQTILGQLILNSCRKKRKREKLSSMALTFKSM